MTTGTFVLKEIYDSRDDGSQPVWQAILDDIVINADFNSKGAAQAAINVERARRQRRERWSSKAIRAS